MRIGIDLGGTKIEIITLDDSGHECYRKRTTTPQGDYPATVAAIAHLVTEAEVKLAVTSTVGVGIPGAISPATGLVKNANSICLIGKPLQQDLEQALQRKIRIANDANCFTISEAVDGAAAGASVVFGVIIGTGTGGGIAINQRVITGNNAIAGEWGHNPLPWAEADELPGTPCYCGKTGCIETWLSGSGFSRYYQQLSGELITVPEVVQAAASGETTAEFALQQYERRLAKSLASVINVLDPDVIVLGGGLSNIDRLYAHVPTLWGEYVFSDVVTTRLLPPKHGDSSGVRGAAWLW